MQSTQSTMVSYYMEKYGDQVISRLEQDAIFCEQVNDLHRRNRLLRVRDEILLQTDMIAP